MVDTNSIISINKLLTSSEVFSMSIKKRDTFEMAVIFTIIICIIMFLTSSCTYTIHRPPMKLRLPPTDVVHNNYQYYVIDEHSTVPDAYFISKRDAEKYKEYFKDNHNYVIVELQ